MSGGGGIELGVGRARSPVESDGERRGDLERDRPRDFERLLERRWGGLDFDRASLERERRGDLARSFFEREEERALFQRERRGDLARSFFEREEERAFFERESVVPIPRRPCLLYTSPSPRDKRQSRMPSSA